MFESGFHDGMAWYAMELLEGPTLAGYLAEARRPLGELALVFRQVVEALEHCHREGIVHRDLNPENIIVTPRHQARVRAGRGGPRPGAAAPGGAAGAGAGADRLRAGAVGDGGCR